MKRLLLLLPFLCLMPSAQAVDYVKCEAMNKMYGRVRASMRAAMDAATEDFIAEYGSFPLPERDPEGYAKWQSAMDPVAAPYNKKIERITADYAAEGCE